MSDIPVNSILFVRVYPLPVEVVIILLLAAVIGRVVTAMKSKPESNE
jgi:NADH:ubiquinone oxidoreductase subunit 6 (subunit J)